MIARALASVADSVVSIFSPIAAVRRANARRIERGYAGAEHSRLNAQRRPKNQSANTELAGPSGADAARALARQLVRDNAYAWSALEAIVSETIGTGFGVESMLESDTGQDEEDTNENRDRVWRRWAKVCNFNGKMTFNEIQTLAFREMVEAGECLIRFRSVPARHKGVLRPVPLALELIQADRLASDNDTYAINRKQEGYRITRGVEMDEDGNVVAYHIYPAHPTEPNVFARTPERIDAGEILHLFRQDRIDQSRGVTWYAPIIGWLRDMGFYLENELQASAVDSCFTVAIKSDTPVNLTDAPSTAGTETSSSSDADGNQYDYLQPGMIMHLDNGQSIESASPSRPNSNAGAWIALMLRGVAAGTGTSYESVSKDFSNTSYSSSRTSKLENRPRYRRWQDYWMAHFCAPIWERFNFAAALAGLEEFPTATELLDDFEFFAPVEFSTPHWEWVDVQAEQQSSEAAIAAHQRSGTEDIASRGGNYRRTQRKLAQEKAYRMKLSQEFGVPMDTAAEAQAKALAGQGMQAESQAAATAMDAGVADPAASGELAGLSTLQFNRNRKAIGKVLDELANGEISESKARVFLSGIGMKDESIDALIADASDGRVDELPEATEAVNV